MLLSETDLDAFPAVLSRFCLAVKVRFYLVSFSFGLGVFVSLRELVASNCFCALSAADVMLCVVTNTAAATTSLLNLATVQLDRAVAQTVVEQPSSSSSPPK